MNALGDFASLPSDVFEKIMRIVVDEGFGDAALFSMTSKSVMNVMWPLLRESMFKCPAAIRSALLPEWKKRVEPSRVLTAVRVVVKDEGNVDMKRWGVRMDLGSIGHRYPRDIATVMLDWRRVASFLKWRPGIDVVILDSACVPRAGFGVSYLEYAVLLALLHVRRWLVRYACDFLAVFPDRQGTPYAFNVQRLDHDWFERPFHSLMTANRGRLFLAGPKTVYWGRGVDVHEMLRWADPFDRIDMTVAKGSTLCAENVAIREVFLRLPEGPRSDLLIVCKNRDDAFSDVQRAQECGFDRIAVIVSAGAIMKVPPGKVLCIGKGETSYVEVTSRAPTDLVVWGDPESWIVMAASRGALDMATYRGATEEEKDRFIKGFPLVWEGMVF